MATSFDTIEDLFLISVRDYRIDALASNQTVLQQYLDGFLIKAVPNFTACLQDLSYDSVTRTFTSTFTNLENEILANLMEVEWFKNDVNDVTQINLHLMNHEFKLNSENENLKQKSEYLDRAREKAHQLATEYQLLNISSIPYYSTMNII